MSTRTGAIHSQLNYNNFKSEVARVQGHQRAATYHHVWDALYALQQN